MSDLKSKREMVVELERQLQSLRHEIEREERLEALDRLCRDLHREWEYSHLMTSTAALEERVDALERVIERSVTDSEPTGVVSLIIPLGA